MNFINAETVYETLIGEMEEQYRVPGVENAFAEGKLCDRLYQEVYEAYIRLCQRLGNTQEDPDLELIIDHLQTINKQISLKMYHYARKLPKQPAQFQNTIPS